MEFTYNGIVRQGFGFYNPNHAAALLCAVFPFVWAAWFKWRACWIRALVAAVLALLLMALAATFSRTGLLVLAGEVVMFGMLRKGCGWKAPLALICAAGAGAAIAGVCARFVVDASLLNRFAIWKTGAELFAANPWQGVGLGNSGRLASAFLLPDDITVRTLVNSHLTLLAEFGAVIGFAWIFMLAHAFSGARRHPAACVSLAGLCVSSFMASALDWHVLFDFKDFGGFGLVNHILSWLLFLFAAGLVAFLSTRGFSLKRIACAAGTSAAFLALLWCGFRGAGPKIENGFILPRTNPGDAALVLYGDDWDLRRVRRFLSEKDCLIPLHPWQGEAPDMPVKSVVLFGDCASYASEYPDADVELVAPPLR